MPRIAVLKPVLMREKEIAWGLPFEEKVILLYSEHRTYEGVAAAIGISRQTLHAWLSRLGITWEDLRIEVAKRASPEV
jgi:hypothetical protein